RRLWAAGPGKTPGDDLLSRCWHYHRPRLLNGRVRNGNGCFQPGLLTGMSPGPPTGGTDIKMAAVRVALVSGTGRLGAGGAGGSRRPPRAGSMRPSARLLVPVS